VRRGAANVEDIFSLDEMVELLDFLGPEVMETVAQPLRHKRVRSISLQVANRLCISRDNPLSTMSLPFTK